MCKKLQTLTIVVALIALGACSGPGGSITTDDTLPGADGEIASETGDILAEDGVTPDLHITKDVPPVDADEELIEPDVVDPDVVDPDVVDPDVVDPDVIDPDVVDPDVVDLDVVDPDTIEPTCETDEDCLDALEEAPGACLMVYCHVATGICVQKALPDGQPCEDADSCVEKSVCVAGACEGSVIVCDDDNICTDDTCNPESGCEHENNDDPCEDGNPCTGGDTCFNGGCVGSGNECPCATDDDCFEQEDGDLCNGFLLCIDGSCVVNPETIVVCEGTDNACLTVECDAASGDCIEMALDEGTICDDGSICTTGDACVGGQCSGTGEFLCDDENSCTDDACDPDTGCVFTPADGECTDGDPCTGNDTCIDGLCIGEAGANCDCEVDEDCADLEDDDLCNGSLICVDSTCVMNPETVVVCEEVEDDACNVQKCDPETGECGPIPVEDGTLCDDEDPCSFASECEEGICTGFDLDPCDDENPCTADSCETGEGCVHEAQDGDCDDADFCTENDTCVEGFCAGAPILCDDDNICTDDSCEPAAGCVFTENSVPCDDDSVCTTVDLCQGGACVGTEELLCEEENPCKAAKCDAVEGCFSVDLEAGCDDANACTVDDICVEGECEPGAELECDDGDICTDDSCDPVVGCVFTPNTEPCEDGDACTENDLCTDGKCLPGEAVICNDDNVCTDDTCDFKKGCIFSANEEGCDDADACTTVDICANSECVGTEPLDCDDDNLCTEDSCDAIEGCLYADNVEPCDDGNICTVDDACGDGACQPGIAQECDDDNICTKDTCDPTDGCIFEAMDGECEDGSVCTEGDTCVDGTCVAGEPIVCNDENDCTSDSCDPADGCIFSDNTLACDDGSACTTDDVCTDGSCVGAAVICDDKNDCTNDSCDPDVGCVFTPNNAPCDDGSLCTEDDMCDDGACQPGEPLDCDDDNVCTSDTCIPAIGCVQVNNNNSCEDGDACTTKDKCNGGECKGGGSVLCDDQNPCTDDACDSDTGCYAVALQDGLPCDDGNGCTDNDECSDGECVGVGLQCDDDNPCTDNKCVVGIGCLYPPNTAPCDDENVCTLDDICTNGQCGGTSQLDCDDNNPCTNDLCDATEGCIHLNNTAKCDDQNACTEGDTCADGVCYGGPKIPCVDENICTDDSCDPALGCIFSNNQSSCDDGNPCTVKDHCDGGVCVGGGDLNCDDENPCTNDMCIPDLGCIHSYNTDPCDDGNACSVKDVCKGGECLAGAPLDCDDDNICTTDSCDPANGCQYKNNNFKCDDGKKCTVSDVCGGGVCAGKQKDCDDNNVCTVDSCDAATGECEYANAENGTSCNDSKPCTVQDKCTDGVCGGAPKDCDDDNECTKDSCVPILGGICSNQPLTGQSCDDDDKCTTDDVCSNGGVCGGDAVECDDYNPCTDDSCSADTGSCIYVVNDECDELELPQYDAVGCQANYAFTPASGGVGWGQDGTPAAPGPLTGTCALNYNNGTTYPGTTSGRATSAFWFDASGVNGTMTLAFHSYNGADPSEDADQADRRYVEASTDGFNTVDWTKTLLQSENKGSWVIENFDLSELAGEKFQLRFRFESVDSVYNNGPGWFVEDVNIYLGPVVTIETGKPLSETFEDNTNGWQFFGGKNDVAWAIDATAADPGKFAGSTSLNFNDGVDFQPASGGAVAGIALSPVIDLTGLKAGTEISLVYRSWHQTEVNNSYDRRYTEASALAFSSDTKALLETNVGEMNGWKISSLNLTAFAGKKIRLRFRFDTIDGAINAFKGWFVDNASVSALPAPVFADGIICQKDSWTYSNPTPPVIWDVDATAADPGYSSSDCSLNFNDGTDIQLGSQKVHGSATSAVFTATAPADAGQKLYLDFKSYLGVETNTYYDVTTVNVKESGGLGSVTFKLPKGADLNKWVQQSVDISSLQGKKVRIIFTFDSIDGAVNAGHEGPFIDDVMVRAK